MAYRECMPAQDGIKVSECSMLDRVFRDVGRRQARGSCGVGAQQLYRPVRLWLSCRHLFALDDCQLATGGTRLILVSDERDLSELREDANLKRIDRHGKTLKDLRDLHNCFWSSPSKFMTDGSQKA